MLPGPRYYWRYLLDQDAIIAAQREHDYVTMGGFYIEHLQPRLFADLEGRLQRASHELVATRREGGGGHGDLAVRVIASMVNDSGEQFVVNVRNRGAVANLPEDAILELSARVDRQGAHPLAVGNLPESLSDCPPRRNTRSRLMGDVILDQQRRRDRREARLEPARVDWTAQAFPR